jgi:hypothetical protein
MSAMEPTVASQPPVSEPVRADTTNTFKTPNAPPGRHFEPSSVPGLGSGQILPDWVHKLFRRKDAPAAR